MARCGHQQGKKRLRMMSTVTHGRMTNKYIYIYMKRDTLTKVGYTSSAATRPRRYACVLQCLVSCGGGASLAAFHEMVSSLLARRHHHTRGDGRFKQRARERGERKADEK